MQFSKNPEKQKGANSFAPDNLPTSYVLRAIEGAIRSGGNNMKTGQIARGVGCQAPSWIVAEASCS